MTGSIYLGFAKEISPTELSKDIANQYILNSLHDENWKDNNPRIVGDGTNYYADKDTPSYIEYKVSCKKSSDCWFIMVNVDWDDVSIPLASTYGSTNYEVLGGKIDKKLKEKKLKSTSKKLYYFWPFEQYIQDEDSREVDSVDPAKQDVQNDKLEDMKFKAREFKKTDVFKKIKQELKSKWLTSLSDKSILSSITSYAALTTTGAPDIFVPGNSTVNCPSRIPCYTQFQYTYGGSTCYSGCAPTAIAMVFGYHDRQLNYPNLVSWTATDYIDNATTNSTITTLINNIRTRVGTYCSSWNWATTTSNQPNAINYAISNGYLNARAFYVSWTPTALLGTIQTEVNAGRPVVINTATHSLVAYGYSSVTVSAMIRVNYGWGRLNNPNVDVSVNAININGSSYAMLSLTRYLLSGWF